MNNTVMLIGKLVGTPQFNTYGDKKKASFSLMVGGISDNKDDQGRPQAAFFAAEAWGQVADFIESHKDDKPWLSVVGSLGYYKGDASVKTYIKVSSVKFLPKDAINSSYAEKDETPAAVGANDTKGKDQEYDPFADE